MTPPEAFCAPATANATRHGNRRLGVQVTASVQLPPTEHCRSATADKHRRLFGSQWRREGQNNEIALTMDVSSGLSGEIVRCPAFRVNRRFHRCFSLVDGQDKGAAGSTARTANIA